MVDIKFENFFDRDHVTKAIDSATKAVLSKAGAFIRQRSKSSIRKRKRSASPGSPPSSHTGILKDLIFFQFDPDTKSVVIGPKLSRRSSSPTAPEKLEFGTGGYQKFPFMAPAEQAERSNFPTLFKDAVK